MLLDTLKSDLITGMKSGDKVTVETLRLVISAIKNFAITKYGSLADSSLTDEDCLDVIKKQAKTRNESIEAFSKAGRTDLVVKEEQELEVIKKYLPEEISESEILNIINKYLTSGEKNFGLLMKNIMSELKGQVDGKKVSSLLTAALKK